MGFSTTVLLITDDWVQRKLGEVAPLQRGFDLPKSEMCAGEYPVVMSNGINGFHSEFKAKAPGVVTGRSGTIGNLFFIEKDYWPHNTALWVTDFMGNHPKFIYHLYRKVDLNRFGTGTGVPTLNRNDVHAEFVFIPNIKEQIKISEFYTTFDKINGLYKRKTENLKLLKKACLQQMFPNDGETVPKIRFTGFTGDWEEVKLGDVVKVNSGRDYKHLNFGNIPVYGTGGYMLSVDESLSDNDAIGIGRKGTIDKPQLLRTPFWTVDTLFFMIPEKNNDLLFLYALSQGIEWAKLDESTGVPSLSKINIENIVKYFPSFPEQAAIGGFFLNLDMQISAQAQILEQYKKLKMAYLHKMFI